MMTEITLKRRENQTAIFETAAGQEVLIPEALAPATIGEGQTVWLAVSADKPESATPAQILNEVLRTDETSKLA